MVYCHIVVNNLQAIIKEYNSFLWTECIFQLSRIIESLINIFDVAYFNCFSIVEYLEVNGNGSRNSTPSILIDW